MDRSDSQFLCRFDDLLDGDSRGFDTQGSGHDTVLVVRRGAQIHAWLDACPHYGGTPLAWRRHAYLNAARDRIVCAAHGAQFEIDTGLCTIGPCLGDSLTPLPVELTECGRVLLVMTEGSRP